VSAGVAFASTPLVRKIVVRMGAIDQPSDRKIHAKATPTMGGLAMYLGLLAGIGVSRVLPFFKEMNAGSSEPIATLFACSAIVLLGAVDDLRGTSPLTKFTGQIFVAGLLILAGVQVTFFWFPGLGIVSVDPNLAVLLTITWVVVIVNAVNLADGLDGLAAGMVAIAAVSFFVYMVHSISVFGEASAGALLAAIAAGVSVGFLPWNFNPAKIFMGDSGSHLIGMLLAIATISGVGRNFYKPGRGDFAVFAIPVLVPLVVLAIPFLDVLLAVARRVRKGVGIGHPDKQHIHHRLLELGHGYRRTVLRLYLWSALISGTALAVGLIGDRAVVGVIALGAVAVFLGTAVPLLARPKRTDVSGNGRRKPSDRTKTGALH